MNAALRLSWYKFKHHYMDFVKVLLGIIAFEGLILYIQDKGFLKDFETTRMTLFLLLFSTSLLIVVQNSIYISKTAKKAWIPMLAMAKAERLRPEKKSRLRTDRSLEI